MIQLDGRATRAAFESWVAQAHAIYGLPASPGVPLTERGKQEAERVVRWTMRPHGLRRAFFVADQLGHGFSRDMVEARYGAKTRFAVWTWRARHLATLLGHYRGDLVSRLWGRSKGAG